MSAATAHWEWERKNPRYDDRSVDRERLRVVGSRTRPVDASVPLRRTPSTRAEEVPDIRERRSESSPSSSSSISERSRPNRTTESSPTLIVRDRDPETPPPSRDRNPQKVSAQAQSGKVPLARARMRKIAQENTAPSRTARAAVSRAQNNYRTQTRPDAYRRLQERRLRTRGLPKWWHDWSPYDLLVGVDEFGWDFLEAEENFWNPVFLYYFSDSWDESLAQEWFEESNLDAFYRTPFRYVGVLLPTQTLEELLLEISMASPVEQKQFRDSLQRALELLEVELQSILGKDYRFGKNEITVDGFHYEKGMGVVIEGTAGPESSYYPYKALLNLKTVSETKVFLAAEGPSTTSPENLEKIIQLNAAIRRTLNAQHATVTSALHIKADAPSWYGVAWTKDFCVTAANGGITSNPLNHQKIGSAAGIRLANMICAIKPGVLKELKALEEQSYKKIRSYPNPKVIAFIDSARKFWSKDSELLAPLQRAFQLTDEGCSEYKYNGKRSSCKKRLISKKDALQLKSYLERELQFKIVFGPTSDHDAPENQQFETARLYIATLSQKALEVEAQLIKRELEAITLPQAKNFIASEWMNQFFNICKSDFNNQSSLFARQNLSAGPLGYLLIQSMEWSKFDDSSSMFLNSVRRLGGGEMALECKTE